MISRFVGEDILMAKQRSLSATCMAVLIGAGTLAHNAAMAGETLPPGVTVTGTLGAPNCGGYSIYEPVNAPFPHLVQNNTGTYTVDQALVGNSASPGGNVELCDGISLANFGPAKCLSGTFATSGDTVTACSLTAADWQTVNGTGKTLARRYYEAFFAVFPTLAATLNAEFAVKCPSVDLFTDFFDNPAFQTAFSAPNIAYVNQNGDIKIGLEGLYNATPVFAGTMMAICPGFNPTLLAPFNLQASQVVRVQVNGGNDLYLYSFQATQTGRYVDADGNPFTFDADCLTNLALYSLVYGTQPGPTTPFQVCSYSGNYEVLVDFDFGDLPDNYGTLLGSDGARHYILPEGNPYLGTIPPDDEGDGQPTASAEGDNTDFNDDEDGVTFPPLYLGSNVNIAVDYVNPRTYNVYINGWMDIDGNGTLEHIADDIAVPPGSGQILIPISIPPNATPGPLYSRFRISSQYDLGLTGAAPDGEVEDYVVELRERPTPVPFHPLWLTLLGLALPAVYYRRRALR